MHSPVGAALAHTRLNNPHSDKGQLDFTIECEAVDCTAATVSLGLAEISSRALWARLEAVSSRGERPVHDGKHPAA